MIIGVDEVGRGAWAGPLVACAYVRTGDKVEGLRDPKKMSRKQRESLYGPLIQQGVSRLSSISPSRIDKEGVTLANLEALETAINALVSCFRALPDVVRIVVDGRLKPRAPRGLKMEVREKADNFVYEVQAAALIAKVERDALMTRLPGAALYGWESNAGYGTAKHRQALHEHGVSEYHRRTFLRTG